MNVVGAGQPAVGADAIVAGRRRSSAMFSAIVPRNSVGRCGTQAIERRQVARSQRARSTPPTVIRPASGSAKRSSRRATVLLPAPLGPTARRLTRRQLELDIVEHGAARAG